MTHARTADVQVTGTIHTYCSAGTAVDHPTKQAFTTLLVIRTDQVWRVEQRLF